MVRYVLVFCVVFGMATLGAQNKDSRAAWRIAAS